MCGLYCSEYRSVVSNEHLLINYLSDSLYKLEVDMLETVNEVLSSECFNQLLSSSLPSLLIQTSGMSGLLFGNITGRSLWLVRPLPDPGEVRS